MKAEILANYFCNRGANQNEAELTELIKILKKEKMKNILEIGVDKAGTLKLWRELVKGIVIGVDLSYIEPIEKIILIQGNSHDDLTIKKIERELGKNKIDFLFIDGDHSYFGVKEDFEKCFPFVKKNGIIGFHDIKQKGIDVKTYWNEIKSKYKSMEIYCNEDEVGIGLLRKE